MSLLGLDVGTTGCKAIAFDVDGVELARSYREYPLQHPRPGWVEISPRVIWQSVCEVLREVNGRAAGDPVAALSISCQGEAVLPVDATGEPLHDFIITFDSRTQPQCDRWRREMDPKELFRITGMPLHPMYSINKVMWLRENRSDVFRKTWKFLCVQDYLIYRLTGIAATDYSLAARTMALDIVKRDWSDAILAKAGVDRSLLPELHCSGTAVGEITREASEETGLPRKAVVATGGHDQPCGALGAGITRGGMAMNATGTSDVICPALETPITSKAMLDSSFCCYPHTCEDLYCSIAFNLTGGLLLRWYRDALCSEEAAQAAAVGEDPYDAILADMSDEPTDLFILPHFVGSGTPYLDPSSRGAILGLTLQTGKPHLARAILDSLDYEVKLNIDRMERAGIGINTLRAIGGGAKSERWLQMKADLLGKPIITLRTSEAASLGTALLAAKAIGIFPSARAAADALVRTGRTFEPRRAEHERYMGKYQSYLGIYEMLRPFNTKLASGGSA